MRFRKTGLRLTALLAFISTAAIAGNRENDRAVELLSQEFEQASPAESISGKWNCTLRASRPGSNRVIPFRSDDPLIFEFSDLDAGVTWRRVSRTGYYPDNLYIVFDTISRFSRSNGTPPQIEAQTTLNLDGGEGYDVTTANFRRRADKLIVEFRDQKKVAESDISSVLSKFTVAALMECVAYVEPPFAPQVLPENVYEKKGACAIF